MPTDYVLNNQHRLRIRHWIRELLSNNYTQGQTNLHTEGKFCCLGVACDISEIGAWIKDSYTCKGKATYLHTAAQGWEAVTIEMQYGYGFISTYYGLSPSIANHLIYMNDHDADFHTIARYLSEEVLEEPFTQIPAPTHGNILPDHQRKITTP